MMASNEIISHLERLFQAVFQVVTQPEAHEGESLGHNAKGDAVKWFDMAADKVVCDYLATEFPDPVRLWSEEGDPRQFGRGRSKFTMILDPVDGSENFSRGLPPSGLAMALIPEPQPIACNMVQFALIGNLFTQDIWWAERGYGAFCNGVPIQTSAVESISQAFLSCDLNQATIQPEMAIILSQARGVRACGAATLDLARVANGTFDAHLDLRGTLTPENFIAPALLISEAGGLITDPRGQPLPPIQTLTERYAIVAAANRYLHQAIVQQLQQ